MNSLPTNEKEKNANPEDIDPICKFPEGLIGHMLSFLPTKEAVGTSVLASNWKNNWKFITHLNFDDTLLYSKEGTTSQDSFVKFVYNVLRNVSSSKVESFKLLLSKKYNPDDVEAWISAVLRREIQKLYVKVVYPAALPSNLFECNSLVELELATMCSINAQSFICLENLQVLKLYGIIIESDHSPDSEELVFSFPVLKVFEADFYWERDVVIKAPLLESFTMADPLFKHHRVGLPSPAIKIFSLHLRKFSYKCKSTEDIILSDSLSIVDASIQVLISHNMEEHDISQVTVKARELVRQFHRLESLKLEFILNPVPFKIMVVSCMKDYLLTLPVFGCLVNLELSFCSYLPCQDFLLPLLHRTPILQKLVLLYGIVMVKDILTSEEVPRCLLSSLKSFELIIRCWDENILCVVKYMLEHCHVLEQMIVSVSMLVAKEAGDEATKKVEQVLLSTPRASGSVITKVEMID